jgi:hypothetical protein
MFPLATAQIVHLSPSRPESPRVLSANAEQHKLRNVSEVKSHAASIRASVFADLVPNDVAFVVKAPGIQNLDRQPVAANLCKDFCRYPR